MLIAGIEFPDSCPQGCPFKQETFDQSSLCTRCPIFNCKQFPFPCEDGTEIMMSLIEPNEYREDWAKEWKRWFDEGMKDYPELYLQKRGE